MAQGEKPSVVPAQEIERQERFAQKAAALLAARYPRGYKAYVHVYGCQQNISDGERLKGFLTEMGYEMTETPQEAELILLVTCAVREHAQDRIYGNVGALSHYRKAHPNAIIALCGCMMQQEHVVQKIRASYPQVNLVFGTHVAHRLPEFVFRLLSGQEKRVFETPDCAGVIAEGIPVCRDSKLRGWLPIMYGCNNFCTYCIVPYVRGRERSRRPEDVLREARELVASGCKDITLLGQNVNSYGNGCDFGVDFADLLEQVCQIPGEFTVRFMTSHPKDCTEKLLDVMARNPKAAGHLHLPFQSGSDRILKAMNRRYTAEKYRSLIRAARERMPDLSLTADVIVGFPGETYEDFKETLSLIREVEFTSLFTFIYSPREGTPASKLPDPVSHEEKAKWMGELLAAQEEISERRNAAAVGKTFRVLAEERDPKTGKLQGRTGGNVIIDFDGGDELIGRFVDLRVTSAQIWILHGELV